VISKLRLMVLCLDTSIGISADARLPMEYILKVWKIANFSLEEQSEIVSPPYDKPCVAFTILQHVSYSSVCAVCSCSCVCVCVCVCLVYIQANVKGNTCSADRITAPQHARVHSHCLPLPPLPRPLPVDGVGGVWGVGHVLQGLSHPHLSTRFRDRRVSLSPAHCLLTLARNAAIAARQRL